MSPIHAKSENTINIILTTERIVRDPIECKGYQQLQVIDLFLDTLVKKDPNLGLVGSISNKWSVNQEQTEYTFEIDPKAKFHNGEKVTSSDIKFSLERHIKENSGSTIGIYLKNVVSTINTKDANSLTISLKGPYPPFLDLISSPGYGIISSKSADKEIIGSGPYKFANQDNNCLLKNENYSFGSSNIEKYCFRIERDIEETISALNNKNIDLAMGSSLDVATSPKLKTELVASPTFSLVTTNIFLNQNVRLLQSAENREKIKTIINEIKADKNILTKFDSSLNTYLPKGIMQETYYNRQSTTTTETDIKFSHSTPLRIVFPFGIFLEESVIKIVKKFEEKGFSVTYKNVKGDALLKPLLEGDFDLFFVPYQGLISDADGYLETLNPEGILKAAKIPATPFLENLSRSRFTKSKKERLDKYEELFKDFEKNNYIIPFSQNSIPIVHSQNIKLPDLNYSYHLNLREISLK